MVLNTRRINWKTTMALTLFLSEKKGTPNVSLKKTASEILRQFYKQPKSADPETQKVQCTIIKGCGKAHSQLP